MRKFNWGMRACSVFLLWATAAIALPAQTTAVAPTVTFTTLHNFDGTDGANMNGLVQATNGNFYGTTNTGGANVGCTLGTCGTIFKITPSGTLTTFHDFDGTDGSGPQSALVQGTDGNFYGTTYDGGTGLSGGTVFKITPNGTLTTLYSFCSQGGSNCTDGVQPVTALVQGTDGNFYGTTDQGGANGIHDGTVFKITPSGALTTLHSFDGTDGNFIFAGLIQATNGNFYGTADAGGANGDGTVFKITPSGTLTTLHSFDGTDGANPQPEVLALGTDGNLYGTTSAGGPNNDGTVFKITLSGALTTLHNFDGTDGTFPYAGLIQATSGKFYGGTAIGGTDNDGTVFGLSVGLGPFVATNPTSGEVGKAVKILGNNLTGATSVTFNGTAATFTVKSKSEITTTVPTGATTGKVKVVTPTRTLKSNVPFRVTP
jgi:uncharacterized repeat protein (TIGR03803 family)